MRHHSEKLYLLSLINAQREKAGAPPLVLGDNAAAQLHAEDSLENCFLSHWGSNGLNSEMRYTLAGGHQSHHLFLTGLNYCITSSDGYRAKSDIKTEIRNWMGSWGRPNPDILDKRNKKVNIGLAWDTYNSTFVLGFEGDYIEYDRLPNIENGILSLSGRAGNGASFPNDTDLGIDVHYDPPPHPLTRGQLSRTYSRAYLRVASLRPRLLSRTLVQHNLPGLPSPLPAAARRPGPGFLQRIPPIHPRSPRRLDSLSRPNPNRPLDHRIAMDGQRTAIFRRRQPSRSHQPARQRRLYYSSMGQRSRRAHPHIRLLHIPRHNPAHRLPRNPVKTAPNKIAANNIAASKIMKGKALDCPI